MKTIPVARSTAYRAVLDALREIGVNLEPYVDEVSIPLEAVAEQDRLLPERPLRLLLDTIREREAVDDLGFRIGACHRVTDLENVGPLLATQPTLKAAIRAFCDQLTSHANTWDFWVEDWSGGVRICRRGTPMDAGRWTFEQYAVVYLTDLVRLAAPDSWWPAEIWLEYDGPLTKAERRALQGAAVHLGGEITAIHVPEHLLALRPRVDRQTLPAFVTESIPTDWKTVFRELLKSALLAGRPSLPKIGLALGLHPRTLQRRLRAEGTSYRELLNEVRLELACLQLTEDHSSIARIAERLGYGATAAFTKAFHRWAGVPPSAYRKANRAAP